MPEIGLEADEDDAPHVDNKFLRTDTLSIGRIFIEDIREHDEKWVRSQLGIKEFSAITLDGLHKAIAFLYGTGAFSNVSYALNGVPFLFFFFILWKNNLLINR